MPTSTIQPRNWFKNRGSDPGAGTPRGEVCGVVISQCAEAEMVRGENLVGEWSQVPAGFALNTPLPKPTSGMG